jgi:hypothetical protein
MKITPKMYKKTGRDVTVSREDLINLTLERLMEYDSATDAKRSRMKNPYDEPIYTKVAGGKTVQVPRYIQNAAIVKWNVLKTNSHTRLARRKRYAGTDPNMLNPELYQNTDNDDDPEDYELSKLRDYEKKRRQMVGRYNVPNEGCGRGGSAGDLPRDYMIFEGRRSADIQDNQNWGTNPRGDEVMPDDLNDFSDPYDQNNLAYQRSVDTRNRNQANQRSVPRNSGRVNPSESDIRTESADEDIGVEHYAPIVQDVDPDNLEPERCMGTKECHSCNTESVYQNTSNPRYRGRLSRSVEAEDVDLGQAVDQEDRDDLDQDDELDNLDQDDAVVGEDEDMLETMDGTYGTDGTDSTDSTNYTDVTYKQLFYLLVFIIFLYLVHSEYTKKQQQSLGNF